MGGAQVLRASRHNYWPDSDTTRRFCSGRVRALVRTQDCKTAARTAQSQRVAFFGKPGR
jgi:hypothetical protein